MNTTVSKSFGLALLLAVGIIAVMVAMGAFTSQRAAATITGASISAEPNTTGAAAKITIVLTESLPLNKLDTITVTFPDDTTLADTTADITGTAAAEAGGTASAMDSAVTANNNTHTLLVKISDIKLTADGDTSFKADTPITIQIDGGVTSLPAEGMHDVFIITSTVDSKVQKVELDVRGGLLKVNPDGAGAAAEVTVTFTDDSLLAVGNTISIELEDFGVPSTISANSVRISGTNEGDDAAGAKDAKDDVAVSQTASSVSVSGDTISITIPDMLPDDGGADGLKGTTLTTVLIRQAAGITLPTAAGDYPAVITTTQTSAEKTTNDIMIDRELSLSPKTGAKGTSVTASGKGWGSTGPVMLWIDDGANGSGTADDMFQNGLEVTLADNVAVSGGAFSVTFTADTGFGERVTEVQARDAAGKTLENAARPTFTVDGSLSLDKDSVKVNEKLEITLSEYDDGDVTAVTIGGVSQNHQKSGSGTALDPYVLRNVGDDHKITFTIEVVPETPLGTQVVSVTAGDETATATVAVAAVPMTVSPTTAALGQEITISATGFNAKAQIENVRVGGETVLNDSNNDPVKDATRLTDNNGNITIRVVVPHAAGTGDRLIRIEDVKGRTGEARLNIPAPTLTLSASESRRSSRVTATGTGFVANDSILLNYDTGSRTRSVATATTNSVGEWSVQFVVPADAGIGETHTVTATSSAKDAATPPNAISTKSADHKVPGAGIELDPVEAASGETIKITGSSFRGYSSVDELSIGGIGLSTVGIQTNAEGSFVANVTVPQLAPGTHNVFVDIGEEEISEQLVIPLDTTRTVEAVFFDLIANESLQTIWRYDFDTRTWTSYTTDPETSFANDLFEVESSDILNINVSSEQTFSHQKGSSLFEGWNLITLN